MMSLTFGLFNQVSGLGPLGPLVFCSAVAGGTLHFYSFFSVNGPGRSSFFV